MPSLVDFMMIPRLVPSRVLQGVPKIVLKMALVYLKNPTFAWQSENQNCRTPNTLKEYGNWRKKMEAL